MSALWRADPAPLRRREPMRVAGLDGVMAIERAAYAFPWTRGNFIDALAAGYAAQELHCEERLVGYFVAMPGVDEMHLLNLTVAPADQGQGHARHLLDEIVALCRARAAQQLWLEVRGSNTRARAVYQRYGFADIGIRRGYYPAAGALREDAIVMNLAVAEAPDGLD